jgi:hypothetical protein
MARSFVRFGNAITVLRTSLHVTGTKLKFCDSVTASETLVGGAVRLYKFIKDVQSSDTLLPTEVKKLVELISYFFHIVCVDSLSAFFARNTIPNYLPL